MMKMNLQKRCFLFVLCLVLILPLFSLGVAAGKDKLDFEYDDNDYVVWELSDDGSTLTSGGLTYTAYEIPSGSPSIYEEAKSLYVYHNKIESAWVEEMANYSSARGTVYSPYPEKGLMLLEIMGKWYIYTTEQAKAKFDAFLSGQTENYYLRAEPYASTKLDPSIVDAMEAERAKTDNKRTEDVVNLEEAHRFDVIVYDETRTYAYTVGAVYRLEDGKDYYLHYLSLGNQHFDADGNFSYRSGSVQLTPLDESISHALNKHEEEIAPNGYTHYEYEYDGSWGLLIPDVGFWVLYSLLGFVAPMPLLIMGLTLPYSKKRGYPKYWRILSVIAAFWILFAALLMILLI